MQQIFTIIPILIFFGLYKFSHLFTTTQPIIIATLGLVICSVVSILWHTLTRKKQEKIAFYSHIAVIIFGSATVIFHNPEFIKLKITIINAIFGFILIYNFLHKNPPIQKMFEGKITMAKPSWQKFSLRLAIMFFTIAIANEIVYRTFSESTWVNFKVFIVPIFSLIYFLFQIRFLMKNSIIKQ